MLLSRPEIGWSYKRGLLYLIWVYWFALSSFQLFHFNKSLFASHGKTLYMYPYSCQRSTVANILGNPNVINEEDYTGRTITWTKTVRLLPLLLWVSDCCLMPNQQFFSYIMARTSWFSMRWWWDPICTRPARLFGFLKCDITATTVHGQTCRHALTHSPDSEPTSLCSFSLVLCA